MYFEFQPKPFGYKSVSQYVVNMTVCIDQALRTKRFFLDEAQKYPLLGAVPATRINDSANSAVVVNQVCVFLKRVERKTGDMHHIHSFCGYTAQKSVNYGKNHIPAEKYPG
jgi:hypothetical protein